MYLADYHTHSATSPDGQLTVSELAEAAVRAGLDEICVTDHVDTVLWGDHRPREHFDWSRLGAAGGAGDIHRAAGHPAGGGAGRGAHGL